MWTFGLALIVLAAAVCRRDHRATDPVAHLPVEGTGLGSAASSHSHGTVPCGPRQLPRGFGSQGAGASVGPALTQSGGPHFLAESARGRLPEPTDGSHDWRHPRSRARSRTHRCRSGPKWGKLRGRGPPMAVDRRHHRCCCKRVSHKSASGCTQGTGSQPSIRQLVPVGRACLGTAA